ncbi:hypothetical protein N7454_001407 [Penicillium verhagenii]|nr:hypothetical protein N7454_001407 [Penicillium verhagenii]
MARVKKQSKSVAGKMAPTDIREVNDQEGITVAGKGAVKRVINARMAALEPGLPWAVVQRLDTLAAMEKILIQEDKHGQVANVRAIMQAYRDGSLTWDPPNVTFWANGILYKGPEQLTTPRLNRYWRELGCPKAWFVEGMEGPGPDSVNFFGAVSPRSATNYMHDLRIAIRPADMSPRLKQQNRYIEYDFMDDTGSKHMLIFAQDLFDIEEICNAMCPEAGQSFVRTAAGSGVFNVVHVEAAIFWDRREDNTKQQVIPWTTITCYVAPSPRRKSQPRLSGVWLRHLLFHITRPDGNGKLYLTDQVIDDSINLTSLEIQNRAPPPILSYYDHAAGPTRLEWAYGHWSHGKREYKAGYYVDNLPSDNRTWWDTTEDF